VCTRGTTHEGRHYVVGCVRHRWCDREDILHPWGQHRQLRLDPMVLYEALLNRSVANWSGGGGLSD
jgi:hypothetical protein